MRKACVFMLPMLLLLGLTAGTAVAQAPIGAIAGRVTDPTGSVVVGATVTITNKATGLKREMKTDSEGAFSAPALPAGVYEVRGQSSGFRQLIRDADVLTGSTTTVDLPMAVGAISEEVTVEAAAAQIDYESHKIDGVIQRVQIENLPLNGRSFCSWPSWSPASASAHSPWPSTTPSSASLSSAAVPP